MSATQLAHSPTPSPVIRGVPRCLRDSPREPTAHPASAGVICTSCARPPQSNSLPSRWRLSKRRRLLSIGINCGHFLMRCNESSPSKQRHGRSGKVSRYLKSSRTAYPGTNPTCSIWCRRRSAAGATNDVRQLRPHRWPGNLTRTRFRPPISVTIARRFDGLPHLLVSLRAYPPRNCGRRARPRDRNRRISNFDLCGKRRVNSRPVGVGVALSPKRVSMRSPRRGSMEAEGTQ